MSTLHAINLCGEVHKDRSASTVAFSLNVRDSSHIMSAKTAVLKVPTSGRKTTNMQLTDFHIPAGQNTTPDCVTGHSKLSLAISLLKLSSSLSILQIAVFAACIMS